MGRKYSVNLFISQKAAAGDLVQIASASTKVTKITAIHVEQSSDYGDAQAEGLRLNVSRGTAGTGGTALTSRPISPTDAAFAGTILGQNTTAMTSPVVQVEGGMNVQGGWHWTPPMGYEMEVAPSAAIALVLVTAPIDGIDMEITILFEELG